MDEKEKFINDLASVIMDNRDIILEGIDKALKQAKEQEEHKCIHKINNICDLSVNLSCMCCSKYEK